MGEVTQLLERWAGGDQAAFDALMPLVYTELRHLAVHYLQRERPHHTLQPTALVHEAYLRLANTRDVQLRNRSHFYGAAAQIMRRVLVDYARQRKSLKRGGINMDVVPLEDAVPPAVDSGIDILQLHQALESLDRVAPECARVVELKYFAGLSIEEIGTLVDAAPATVKRRWTFARAWLLRYLGRTRSL
jgi:RNA polymerase sigma factor (TIGR02999 family)